MSIENKGTIIAPTMRSVNSDAAQMFPFDTNRVTYFELDEGSSRTHNLADDAEAIKILIDIDSDERRPFVMVLRGSGTAWPHVSGSDVWGVVADERTLTFSYPGPGTGIARLWIMEA